MTEEEFQQIVIDTARWSGWKQIYHTHDSRRSPAGFPDLVLARRGRIIFAELKTDKGRLMPKQLEWMATLQTVEVETDGIVSAYIWRPNQLDQITAILQRTTKQRHETGTA